MRCFGFSTKPGMGSLALLLVCFCLVVGRPAAACWTWFSGPVLVPVSDETPEPRDLQVAAVPNPFNPQTMISFDVPQACSVGVDIHDDAGRRVRQLLDGPCPAGPMTVRWDGRDGRAHDVAAGVYFVLVTAGQDVAVRKVALVR